MIPKKKGEEEMVCKMQPVERVTIKNGKKGKGSKKACVNENSLLVERLRQFLVDRDIKEIDRGVMCGAHDVYAGYFHSEDAKVIRDWLRKQGVRIA